MNKAEFDKRVHDLGPVLVGVFATGKIDGGERVNTDDKSKDKGKKEAFAMVSCVVIASRKAYTVKQNIKGDAEIAAALKVKGDVVKEELLMPAKPGMPVYVEISSIKNDKGVQSINGRVIPFTN